MAIRDWSASPAQNENIPDGFPENMPPSLVNDRARQVMAGVRSWYEDAAWTDLGHSLERVSATVFRVLGVDVRTTYTRGRRAKLVVNQTNYVTVASSSFDGNTVVTLSEGAVPPSMAWIGCCRRQPVPRSSSPIPSRACPSESVSTRSVS